MPSIQRTTPFDDEPQLAVLRRRLRRAMDLRGYDITTLAAACELSRVSISFYLEGMRLPQAVSMVRLSRVLGVSCDWLLGFDCPPVNAGLAAGQGAGGEAQAAGDGSAGHGTDEEG